MCNKDPVEVASTLHQIIAFRASRCFPICCSKYTRIRAFFIEAWKWERMSQYSFPLSQSP